MKLGTPVSRSGINFWVSCDVGCVVLYLLGCPTLHVVVNIGVWHHARCGCGIYRAKTGSRVCGAMPVPDVGSVVVRYVPNLYVSSDHLQYLPVGPHTVKVIATLT